MEKININELGKIGKYILVLKEKQMSKSGLRSIQKYYFAVQKFIETGTDEIGAGAAGVVIE